MTEHIAAAPQIPEEEPEQEALFDVTPLMGRIDTFKVAIRGTSGETIDEKLAATMKRGARVWGAFSGNVLDFAGKTRKGDGTFELTIYVEADDITIDNVEPPS